MPELGNAVPKGKVPVGKEPENSGEKVDYKFDYKSDYKEKELTFREDKISFSDGIETYNIMMDWETPIMKRSAEWVTSEGEALSVLEIGYGMGIAAGLIQAYSPDVHTIIELHPDIVERAEVFAADRNKFFSSDKRTAHKKVEVIGGKDWFGEFQKSFEESKLRQYHAVFIDTYNDNNLDKIKDYITKILAPGGRMTWWNPMQDSIPDVKTQGKRGLTYERIKMSDHKVVVPDNKYHTTDTYWMPKYQRPLK
jgi:predicted O-methyltransferase YrrM